MTSFTQFGLAAPITRALADERYTVPTPIQGETIPLVLTGRDVVGIAQTGTGKTAAFALPILHRLAGSPLRREAKSCRVLVLSPTRELSGQILESFRTYGRHLRIDAALAIGGVSIGGQVRRLAAGVDILVATPGRLVDLVKSNALRLDRVEVFVLDEADRMLDMGFLPDIRRIVGKLPAARQTLLFSATMPAAIAELAKQFLKDPARVAVTPVASTAERVEQRIVHLDRGAKLPTLIDFLRRETSDRVLVFTRTKHGADKVVRGLHQGGVSASAIHGNKSQNNRERALAAFRDGSVRTLVATDIAARGIDVDGISHVINFDLPNEPESYVHRIGRTARAGAAGTAISYCSADEVPYLRAIEKLIRMTIPSTRGAAPARFANARSTAERSPHHRAQQHSGKHAAGGKHGQGQGRKGAPTKSRRRRFSRPPQQVRGAQHRADEGEGRNSGHSAFGFMRQS